MTATATPTIPQLADPLLTRVALDAVSSALSMCDQSARCVGLASVPARDVGSVTGLIGVHGSVSGFITLNMSERVAVRMVEGLLGEKFGQLSSQVIDGAGEITNMVVGGIKSALAGSPWAFSQITVPSVIIGRGYQISYAKGLTFLCATFEHNHPDAVLLEDRLLQVSMSLLRP